MSEADRRKWDGRYAEGSYSDRRHPSALLKEWIVQAPIGRALDVASGTGRNAIFMASLGYAVDAIDISPVALDTAHALAAAQKLEIRCIQADLESPDVSLPEETYSLIVMIRYVHLELLTKLCAMLEPGGLLVCEEHLATDAAVVGPRNPAFRVQPGDLRTAAAQLQPVFYSEGIVEDPDGRHASLARLVAQR